jgi:hypothetical protein
MVTPAIVNFRSEAKGVTRLHLMFGREVRGLQRTQGPSIYSFSGSIPYPARYSILIPASLITRLMADDEAAEARRRQQYDPVAQVFSLETDLATFRAYSQAAKHHQLTLEEWCISELNTAADQWFVDGKPAIHHTRQAQASDSTSNECDAELTLVR